MTVEDRWPKCRSAGHEASSPGVKDFMTREESHFQAAKMKKSCSPDDMHSSAKVLMTLESTHFQPGKMPNRGCVDSR
jgi:hypothetical protein